MNIPPVSYGPKQLGSHSSFDPAAQGGSPAKSEALPGPNHSSASRHQEALHIFERSLAMGYEKLKASQGATKEFSQFEPLTAEKVAGNILGFIERRLNMDAAEGATREQLQARLDAGLAGFKKGFAEASEKLKALSMLSPEVEQDIGKTYDKVISGIDALRQKFVTDAEGAEKPIAPKDKGPAEAQRPAYAADMDYQYAIANRFSFQLTTAEGDKVTVSASASRAYAGQYNIDESRENLALGISTQQSMSWSIDGDLNDDEMAAINDLLGKVTDLAGQFFNGNLDQAFDQALKLGYDEEQITAFSLSLTQVEVQRVSVAYQAFNGEPAQDVSNSLAEKLLPLGNFIRDLLDAMDAASVFDKPGNLLGQLSARMITGNESEESSPSDVKPSVDGTNSGELSPGKRLSTFIEQILNSLQ